MESVPYIGEIFALAAPLCWSLAVILFRKTGELVPPLALNAFKNILAIVMFLATMLIVGQEIFRPATSRQMLLLLVSGFVGIGVSDTLFFMTLNRVGAGLQAIINTSYSPSIIVLSVLFLGESLTAIQFVGVALILSAVFTVSRMRGPTADTPRRAIVVGVLLGVATTFTQAVSIVMIKPLLSDVPLLWANLWRLVGGVVASFLLVGFLPGERRTLVTLKNVRVWRVMIPGAVMGTYVSLMFWLGGMKYTQASTAAALNQTATLWTFVLAAVLLHEPVTRKRILGLLLGVGGVALVTFAGN